MVQWLTSLKSPNTVSTAFPQITAYVWNSQTSSENSHYSQHDVHFSALHLGRECSVADTLASHEANKQLISRRHQPQLLLWHANEDN